MLALQQSPLGLHYLHNSMSERKIGVQNFRAIAVARAVSEETNFQFHHDPNWETSVLTRLS